MIVAKITSGFRGAVYVQVSGLIAGYDVIDDESRRDYHAVKQFLEDNAVYIHDLLPEYGKAWFHLTEEAAEKLKGMPEFKRWVL